MPAPPITALPALPTYPTDQPRVFFPRLLTYLSGLGVFRTELLALAAYLDGLSVGGGGSGDMLKANNLSDLLSATTALDNLGLTANGKSLITAANYAAMRTLLGLVIGTDVLARTPSIQSVTSSATVTPTFADDQVNITAQAAALALANPTGTALDGWGIAVRIKDNGTARAITYGTQYRAVGVTLPTTTVVSKTLYLGIVFNSADTKWDAIAVAQEA